MSQDATDAATRLTADKQLDTLYKTVGSLVGPDYHKFRQQLQRQAYAYGWPDYILDPAALVPQHPDLKQQLDSRNAYLVIIKGTDDHSVANLLEACPQGDARRAFGIVHNFFHRNSQAGRTTAVKDFYGASMVSTDTNIIAWTAIVPRRAKVLTQAGGQANEQAQLSILLDGLLPAFKPIQTILNQTDNLTFEIAVAKIMDYAQSEDLVELTKGGGKHAKHNTFTVQDGAQQTDECRGWKRGNCKFGDFCRFKHTGEGGCAPKDRQFPKGQYPGRKRSTPLTLPTPQSTAESTSATSFSVRDHNEAKTMCSYCNSGGHQMRGCPHLKMENEAGTSDVHMVSADKAVDYVFVTQFNRHGGNVHSPDENVVPPSAYQKACAVLTMIFGMLLLAPTGLAKSLARLAEQCTRSPCRVVALLVILAALSYTALARPTVPGEFASIQASSFVSNSDDIQPSLDHEWCSDSGTNRFVTNDINDFVSGTVSTVPTIVAVGGGNVTSPCYGTVIVESLDHGCTMQCMDVLYIPECGKKLMPASPFIRKGCSLVLDDYVKVKLSAKDGTLILSGVNLEVSITSDVKLCAMQHQRPIRVHPILPPIATSVSQ